MPVDPKASPRDKAIALGAVAALILGFVIIVMLYKMTTPPPKSEEPSGGPIKIQKPGAGAGDEG